jgi:hypothetical protein
MRPNGEPTATAVPHAISMADFFFPPPAEADENGIVTIGGELSPGRLLAAYSSGIFPWPMFGDGHPIPWCSPDPRAIIEFDRFHVSRRLARTIHSGKFDVTFDRDFAAVIAGCATAPRGGGGTWGHRRDEAGLLPDAPVGPRAQRRGVVCRSLGRRRVRHGHRGTLRRRVHVLPCPRRVKGGARHSRPGTSRAAATACSTSSSSPATPNEWEPPRSPAPNTCGVLSTPSPCPSSLGIDWSRNPKCKRGSIAPPR